MSSLLDIKKELHKLVVAGLDEAIARLKEILPQDASKRNDLILLETRVTNYFRMAIKGILPADEMATFHAKLSDDLITFISDLTEADLNAESKENITVQAVKNKRGELLYQIPNQMEERREYRCAVRVAYLKEQLLDRWKPQESDERRSIRVANVMSVEMINMDESEPFSIRQISESIQFLEDTDFTEWVFMVKAKVLGEYPLILKVSVLEMFNGREIKKESIIEEQVIVKTSTPVVEAVFKSANQTMDFTSQQKPDELPFPVAPEANTSTLKSRATSLVMAALILTTATYALTPTYIKDWFAARFFKDTPEAMTAYIQEYPKSSYHEQAVFHRLVLAPTIENLNEYLLLYPEGAYKNEALQIAQKLEEQLFETIKTKPTPESIERFLTFFKRSKHVGELALIIKAAPDFDTNTKTSLLSLMGVTNNETTPLPTISAIDTTEISFSPVRLDSIKKTPTSYKNPHKIKNTKGEHKPPTQQVITTPNSVIVGPAAPANINTAPTPPVVVFSDIIKMHDGSLRDIDFVSVKGGTFTMGCTTADLSDCKPSESAHTVTVGDFIISKYEVTQKQWRDIMGDNPSTRKGCDNCPVESVSWSEVQVFLRKLNAKFPARNYRLPTEAEWEYAARGGKQSKTYRYAGDNTLNDVAWFADNAKSPQPIGQKQPNELGLYDMSGNVWEWCRDLFDDYPSHSVTNPKGPILGTLRVFRGGGWSNFPSGSYTISRSSNKESYRGNALGFRLVVSK